MPGISAQDGTALDVWPHVLQCLGKIFTTPFASRIMRRGLGTRIPALFGQLLNEPTIMNYRLAVCVAIQLYEPRLLIVKTQVLADNNTPEQLRSGRFAFGIQCQLRPRAFLGDFTIEPGLRTLYIGQGVASSVLVI